MNKVKMIKDLYLHIIVFESAAVVQDSKKKKKLAHS